MSIDQGYATIAAALIGIGGTLLGLIVSQMIEYFRIGREVKLRQKEKIIERRIMAHEKALRLADTMTLMAPSPGKLKIENGELVRGPMFLNNKDSLDNWYLQSFLEAMDSSVWLSRPACHEINFVQDYIINLYRVIEEIDSGEWSVLGYKLRNDFINMANVLRDKSLDFLKTDAISLNLKDLQKWHKYKPPETLKKLEGTELFKQYGQLIKS